MIKTSQALSLLISFHHAYFWGVIISEYFLYDSDLCSFSRFCSCSGSCVSIYCYFCPLLFPLKACHPHANCRANTSLVYTAPPLLQFLPPSTVCSIFHACHVCQRNFPHQTPQLTDVRSQRITVLHFVERFVLFHSVAGLALQPNYAPCCGCTVCQLLL